MQHPTTETAPLTWRQTVASLLRQRRVRKALRGLGALLLGAGLAWACEFAPKGTPREICQGLARVVGLLGGGQ